MDFSKYKRKYFFLIDKLQVSKTERMAFVILFSVLSLLLTGSFFIKQTYNYRQESYNQILAEFERKSIQLYQQKAENDKRYLPPSIPEDEKDESIKAANKVITAVSRETGTGEITAATEPDVPNGETGKAEPAAVLKININKAGIDELKQLKGIGDATARNIISYRNENGAFKTAEDLLQVRGIGEKRLEDIKPHIVF